MRRPAEQLLHAVLTHARAFWTPVDVGVLALVEQGGKVLLVRHSYKSGWMLPGGAVNRGEVPSDAILRELKEEIGLTHSATPQLAGVYVRRWGFASNLILLYRVREAVFVFKPSFEIRAVRLVDPAVPPDDASPATKRRLQELLGEVPVAPYW